MFLSAFGWVPRGNGSEVWDSWMRRTPLRGLRQREPHENQAHQKVFLQVRTSQKVQSLNPPKSIEILCWFSVMKLQHLRGDFPLEVPAEDPPVQARGGWQGFHLWHLRQAVPADELPQTTQADPRPGLQGGGSGEDQVLWSVRNQHQIWIIQVKTYQSSTFINKLFIENCYIKSLYCKQCKLRFF